MEKKKTQIEKTVQKLNLQKETKLKDEFYRLSIQITRLKAILGQNQQRLNEIANKLEAKNEKT